MVIRGIVVKGEGEGRVLGFPTANIDYESKEAPAPGVYAARARVRAAPTYVGAAVVVGMWTLPNGLPSVEVHVIDHESWIMDHDLYGQEIVVALYDHIRVLKRFDLKEDLIRQIQDDIQKCSAALNVPLGRSGG